TTNELGRVNGRKQEESQRAESQATEAETERGREETHLAKPEARKAAWNAELENQNRLVHEMLDVTDQKLQAEIDRMVNDFKKNYPALDLDTEVSRSYRSVDWYKKQLRQTILFDHVFLPENPEEWPVVTMES